MPLEKLAKLVAPYKRLGWRPSKNMEDRMRELTEMTGKTEQN